MIARILGPGKGSPPLRRVPATFLALLLCAGPVPAGTSGDWPQWGRTPQHSGASPVYAQPLQAILADVVYDPFVEAMKAESDGDLLAHYAAPLVDETGVYMVFKSGVWTGFGSWETLTWSVKKLAWIGGRLEVVWNFDSDWKPEPLSAARWEPVFQPALSADAVWVPGLGGTVFRVSRETGVAMDRLNPFGGIDPTVYVAGGLAVGPDGSVVYDVFDTVDDFDPVARGWLVRLGPGSQIARVDFATLVPGAPAPGDACQGTFAPDQRPWPPSPGAVPPTMPCGAQRPGVNVVPAIAPDGTIFTVSRADGADRYAYLVAVRPDLTPAWTVSLRGILNDGCGVLLPNDSNIGCRTGANPGVDPATNDRPAGRVNDAGTSSPAVLPDGAILYGAYTGYNFSRGHLFKFGATGGVLATYDFGWDVTPAVFPHDGTYSILLKDNHYFSADAGDYYDVTSLDANLVPAWSFRSTNTESCARSPRGALTCVDDHPNGFEWCVNQPAVDAAGRLYLNSEDGTLYGLDADGTVVGSLFLDTALGAAYTPVAIGPDGMVWAQNNGHLFAVGAAGPSSPRGSIVRPSAPEPPPRSVAPR